MSIIAKKICLVGDFAVGKTSLIRRFVDRQFSDEYLTTVGVKISRKAVEIEANKQQVELLIWDIEGQTKFKVIAPSYLQGAQGAIIVADVSRPETVEHLQDHIQLFNSINPQGLIIIALNKTDLANRDRLEKIIGSCQFDSEQLKVLDTYPTSAKTGDNVDEIFTKLTTEIMALN